MSASPNGPCPYLGEPSVTPPHMSCSSACPGPPLLLLSPPQSHIPTHPHSPHDHPSPPPSPHGPLCSPPPGLGLSHHARFHGQHSPLHSYSPSPPHPSTSLSVPVVSNEPSGMQLASFGRGEWPMVELTACFHEEAISVQFQEWGVFAVKHTTVKKRGHLKDKNGNPVGQAWHYTFLLMVVYHAVPFMNQVIDSNLLLTE